MKFRINVKYIVPIVAAFMLVITLKRLFFRPQNPPSVMSLAPISTTFSQRIGGIGVIEPKSELRKISPNIGGVIESVLVKSGDFVKEGDTLFIVDQRLLQAQINSAKIELEHAEQIFNFYKKASNAISKEDFANIKYAAKQAASKLKELETNLELLKVKSPIIGQVLKINARVGEYAPPGLLNDPLVVVGDSSSMQVRVEIDETDVWRLKYQKRAVGALRGAGEKTIDLAFVRIDPLIKEKRLISGDGSEKVDTRVLEAIYSFDNSSLGAVSGQQMDVFIELAE
jgi:multidrug efflux pump subunit AcrA (membrane-fusion protein)